MLNQLWPTSYRLTDLPSTSQTLQPLFTITSSSSSSTKN